MASPAGAIYARHDEENLPIAVEAIVAVVEAAATDAASDDRGIPSTPSTAPTAPPTPAPTAPPTTAPTGPAARPPSRDAFLRAADDPLRMAEMGDGKQGQHECRSRKLSFTESR